MFESLSIINFEDFRFLTNLPILRAVPLLTNVCLNNYTNLVKIDGSIGFLYKLCFFSAKNSSTLHHVEISGNFGSWELPINFGKDVENKRNIFRQDSHWEFAIFNWKFCCFNYCPWRNAESLVSCLAVYIHCQML